MKLLKTHQNKKLKNLLAKVLILVNNQWFKRITVSFLIIYSAYYLISQYNLIKKTLSTISFNLPLLLITSVMLMILVLLSVNTWQAVIASLGHKFPWINIAHVQMLSLLGKYIPGHIWNYSSKVYLSHKLGMPLKLSSFAIVLEIITTYVLAIGLFLIILPGEFFPKISNPAMIILRFLGVMCLTLLFLAPHLVKKYIHQAKLIWYPKQLQLQLFLRAIIWILSSYAFLLLARSIGIMNLNLQNAIAVVTGSFFIGFLAIFVPDGIVIREAVILYLLRNTLATPEAAILSLLFRFQLLMVEFIIILLILIIWRIHQSRQDTTHINNSDMSE